MRISRWTWGFFRRLSAPGARRSLYRSARSLTRGARTVIETSFWTDSGGTTLFRERLRCGARCMPRPIAISGADRFDRWRSMIPLIGTSSRKHGWIENYEAQCLLRRLGSKTRQALMPECLRGFVSDDLTGSGQGFDPVGFGVETRLYSKPHHRRWNHTIKRHWTSAIPTELLRNPLEQPAPHSSEEPLVPKDCPVSSLID
jgi:hypothetical protein